MMLQQDLGDSIQPSVGRLFLLPVPLGREGLSGIPVYVLDKVCELDYFIVESYKTAKWFWVQAHRFQGKTGELAEDFEFLLMHKDQKRKDILTLLKPCREGKDVGLLSDAGCPAIADPGAAIVQIAHETGITVFPYVGPSSIILALMASGFDGQSFQFHGYLPPQSKERKLKLLELEKESSLKAQPQIFIETPYRNEKLIQDILQVCHPTTMLSVSCHLTLPDQMIVTMSIGRWRKKNTSYLHKQPAIFLLRSV